MRWCRWCPSSRWNRITLAWHIVVPCLQSSSAHFSLVGRVRSRWLWFFLVSQFHRSGRVKAPFSSCIVGRMAVGIFPTGRAFLAPSPNPSRFSRIETYLAYPFFDPTQLLRSETSSSDQWIDHNNKVPYNYSSSYVFTVLRPPLGISSACCYAGRRYILFYRPRDQPANNNKGGEKAQQLCHARAR